MREMTCYENISCASQLEVERSACVYVCVCERSLRVKLLLRSFTFSLVEMLLFASHYYLRLFFIEHNFFSNRPQAVGMGTVTSSAIITNTGAPQGCVLSPFTHSIQMTVPGQQLQISITHRQ